MHAESLEEIYMSDINSGLNVQTVVPAPIAKPVDHNALEGTNKGDHRQTGAPAVMPPQPAPRAETNDQPEGVGA